MEINRMRFEREKIRKIYHSLGLIAESSIATCGKPLALYWSRIWTWINGTFKMKSKINFIIKTNSFIQKIIIVLLLGQKIVVGTERASQNKTT